VRAVRPHGQDHGIAIAMRSEDNLWPLLLHHLPFGASPEKPTVLTRVQADAALFLPRPRRSHEEVEGGVTLCWQLDQGCSPRDLSPFVLRLLEVTKTLDALASDDLSAAPATANEQWLS
jgi:hypothetical protein